MKDLVIYFVLTGCFVLVGFVFYYMILYYLTNNRWFGWKREGKA